MSSANEPVTTPPQKPRPRRVPLWKKLLVLLSILLMLGAVSLRGYANLRSPSPSQAPSGLGGDSATPPGARSFVGQTTTNRPADSAGTPTVPTPTAIDIWSPRLFGVGFGFFAGFCIAYAVRTVFKVAAIILGVLLLGAIGLQYAGLIQLDWSSLSQRYDAFATWLGPKAEGFWNFLTTQLPGAGSAIGGAVLGFRRSA